jgi:hypothetical protein
MFMIRMIIFAGMITILPLIYNFFKNHIMKWLGPFFSKIKYTWKRFYRIQNVKRRSEFVWNDLIKYNLEKGWRFGQYETEKRIENTFSLDEANSIVFDYTVTENNLKFNALILRSFDEEKTNDILVLASHFNSLLNFGVVKVSVKYNIVEYRYSGDLLAYMLYNGEIDNDHITHYNLTKDCAWAFYRLLESGDDPVFVFSELLQRKEDQEKAENSVELEE